MAAPTPLFYKTIVPLMSAAHRDVVLEDNPDYRFAAATNAIPIFLDEISVAQGHYPIIFGYGDEPMPFVLTGQPSEGNRFVDAEGQWQNGAYVPAYVRRYPFVLAKLQPTATDLTLCFDADAACLKQRAGEGNLFDGDKPSTKTSEILSFCEQFEVSVQRTRAAMAELTRLDLLIDGEASIRSASGAPSHFRGFRIVAEEKLATVPGADLAALVKTGAMALVYAHLFSLRHLAQFAQPQAVAQ